LPGDLGVPFLGVSDRDFGAVEGGECGSGGGRVLYDVPTRPVSAPSPCSIGSKLWPFSLLAAVVEQSAQLPLVIHFFVSFAMVCSLDAHYRSSANCGDIVTGEGLPDGETDRLFAGEALAHHPVAESSVAAEVEDKRETDNHAAEEAVVARTHMCSYQLLVEDELVEVVEPRGLDSAVELNPSRWLLGPRRMELIPLSLLPLVLHKYHSLFQRGKKKHTPSSESLAGHTRRRKP